MNSPFHIVTNSPWPIIMSTNLMNLTFSTTLLFNSSIYWPLIMNLSNSVSISIQWWRDVIRESTFQGFHNKYVFNNLKFGMILFIISEVMFFFSFFWSYFNSMLSSNVFTGLKWPPINIEQFNPLNIPLLNSIILISSGVTVTWSHLSLINNKKLNTIYSLTLTIILGLYFSYLQMIEYNQSFFSMADSTYGSLFFLMTGFHGIHVIIGTMFLWICLTRMTTNQLSMIHHFGFEGASWYWHFVDVVWLFLYISVYWWNY
uniref:Cytochrome c oxidase subunit 3 n=1 Tax=Prosevania sp. ZJUH_2016031 TaxID=2491170 RepID=A0A3Q8UA45_9HYME|nr:cytochrome c oxidase subunit 3 [Prosevania sp. ZJUH_2016031]